MRTLVMGGSRFMGVAVVKKLLQQGHEVTTFNRGTRRIAWPGPVREIVGDRNDPAAMARLADLEFDGIVDLSAYTGAQTKGLLAAQGSVQRLVHVSTGVVYEPQPVLPWPEETPYGPWGLWGGYAVEKLACESLLRERSANLATVAIRLPYVLGPCNYVDREEFVLNRLLDGEEILLPGDGKAVQQFVSTEQVAHALVAALERIDSGWHAFNVASAGFVSLEGFVQICAEIARVEPRYRCVGGGPTGTGSPVFNTSDAVFPFPNENYVLDLRASSEAGIAPPPVSIEEMVHAALDAMLAQPERRTWERTGAELSVLGHEANRETG